MPAAPPSAYLRPAELGYDSNPCPPAPPSSYLRPALESGVGYASNPSRPSPPSPYASHCLHPTHLFLTIWFLFGRVGLTYNGSNPGAQPPPPTRTGTTPSPDSGEEADDDKAILQIIFPLNSGSVFAIIQVWTSDRDSLSSYDIILIYFIVCSAAAASFFSRVAHRLLRNPPVARKWLFKAAITFTCWDIIGWTCILLPGVAKLVVAALLCFLIIFFAIWSPEPEVSDSSIDNV